MQPPSWAVEDAVRLDLDGFGTEFSRAWSRLESRFLKVEAWQSYRESADNESQQAFERGDVKRAHELLRYEAEADRPLYEDVQERGIDFARIRIVQPPLTDYLRYEMVGYRIRSEMGESIEVVPASSERVLPDGDHFDFLLFDRDTALVHDYGRGPTGVQTGGWLVRESAVLRRLEARALELRAKAEPLARFLAAVRP
ncbi:DUF6879 family protein [Actinorugispora endophytica]|uniref:DUF6879 domain-containing protein n=1 Tax=Actinorugispora endophytica TaxID=1605990 RepID=A0A4R6V5R1_9ACTN|nr:DUF6879 family protein [Actinorugispora endophytica]TDQ53738.1 hypothetical protein EV190_103189 [Actinorugispora endophytica]